MRKSRCSFAIWQNGCRLRVTDRPCRASMKHDVATPFFVRYFYFYCVPGDERIDMRMEGVPLEDESLIELNALISLAYNKAIEFYLRHVLLRCSKYTNNRNIAEKIAVYTFITAYEAVEKLEQIHQFGPLVSDLVDQIGPAILKEESKIDNKNIAKSDLLLSRPKMVKLAAALNRVDEHLRQVLVLRDIEMMNTKELTEIYDASFEDMHTLIAFGQKQLIEQFASLWNRNKKGYLLDDTVLLLFELDKCLGCDIDSAFRKQITTAVMVFLFKHRADIASGRMAPNYWKINPNCLN